MGRRCHGTEETKKIYDFDAVFDLKDFKDKIEDLIKGHENVYIDLYDRELYALRDLIHENEISLQQQKLDHRPQNIKHIA